MKYELSGNVIIKFVGVKGKTYSYSIDDGIEDKKAKWTKKFVIKRKLKFENFKKPFRSKLI